MKEQGLKTVGVVVPTLNAEKHLRRCLGPVLNSPRCHQCLVVDSGSEDGTVTLAKELGADVICIPRHEFNHGTTREMARLKLGCDILVMLTQDAYPIGPSAIDELVAPIERGEVVLTYGRQLADESACACEVFHRSFNYPAIPEKRSLKDLKAMGKRTFFCSNVFAAYANFALDKIGGFRPTSFGEDTVAAAMLLRYGFSIAYVPKAAVYHTHQPTIGGEFQRYFDMSVARYQQRFWLDAPKGKGDGRRGFLYVKHLFRFLRKENPSELPFAIGLTAARFSGYILAVAVQRLRSLFRAKTP